MLERKALCKGYTIAMICFLLIVLHPPQVLAANSGWDAALSTIDRLHDSLSALELANKLEKQKIQALRKKNNDKRKDVNTKIKLIDSVKLNKLKAEAELARKKYAPILANYTDLGRKASEARKRKDSKAVLLYDLKKNRIKASVIAARKELSLKNDAITSAKKQALAKAKHVRDVLVPVQSLKKQITAENNRIKDRNENRIAANKRYRSAIKQGDALTASVHLEQIVRDLSQIHASQQKIVGWEENIQTINRTAESKL